MRFEQDKNLILRTADLNDAAALCALGALTFDAKFGHLYPEADLKHFLSTAYALEKMQSFLAADDTASWVIEAADGHLIGYAQAGDCKLPVTKMPDGAVEMMRLYVHPDYLGQKLGGRLMDAVVDWVASKGDPPFFLGVWSENDGAQRFYARYGFEKVGEYGFPVGQTIDREFIFQRRQKG